MKQTIKLYKILTLVFLISVTLIHAATPPAPYGKQLNEHQLKWLKNEMLLFVHFGLKTYYVGKKHGNGKEDPQKFNPQKLDCSQWVDACNAAGFKGIVLTAKHHDGFCNWPTQSTTHDVTASPWKNGQGDLVKDVADAFQGAGMWFGLYLSAYDLNFLESGAPAEDYNDVFMQQLDELTTNYGHIDELWFDGFGSGNMTIDKKQREQLIRTNQPHAVCFGDGGKVNPVGWPGNEECLCSQPNWYNGRPVEADCIAQGNWFWNNTPVVSLDRLKEIYRTSVARGAVALINVGPNQEGLVDEATMTRLQEFGDWVRVFTKHDYAKYGTASASNVRGNDDQYSASKAIDGNHSTYWATDDGVTNASIEIDLGKEVEIKAVILQEYVKLGQRIESHTVSVMKNGSWQRVGSATTVGQKRVLEFSPVKTQKVKVDIKARAAITLKNLVVTGTDAPPVDEKVKANNSSNLDQAASWIGGVVPTSFDTVIWDNTVTAANSCWVGDGASHSWAGIKVVDPGGPVEIKGSDGLTLGGGGIDLGSATQSLTFNSPVRFGADQEINTLWPRNVTFNSAVSGAYSVNKVGTGYLFYTSNDIAYSGGTTISNGTVYIGHTDTTGVLPGDVVNNALLRFARSDDYTYSGVISGTGQVQHAWIGRTTLTGNSSYSGTTTVVRGELTVNGSLAKESAVTVDSGSTISGTGTIGGSLTIDSSGTVEPGDSGAGKLTVGGGVTLSSTSVVNVDLGTLSDTLAITGDLTLDGTLNINAVEGISSGTYTIMTYTGTLKDNKIEVGSVPEGATCSITAEAGKVLLTVEGNVAIKQVEPILSQAGFPLSISKIGPGQISFSLPNAGDYSIDMFSIDGRKLVTHKGSTLKAGSYTLSLNPKNELASGYYLVQLKQGTAVVNSSAVFVK